MEKVRNRVRTEFNEKDENDEIIKQQSKLTLMESTKLTQIKIINTHLGKMKILWMKYFT